MTGFRYMVAIGPVTNDFASNIVWLDGTHDCGLSVMECARSELALAPAIFIDFEIITDSPFATNGDEGWKIVTEQTEGPARIRQTYYFFGASHNFLLATYTRSADQSQQVVDAPAEHSILSVRMLD